MTSQRLRRQDTSEWTTLFPSDIRTRSQSVVFVKRMMVVAVSSITYLRGIFPEGAYQSRYLEDLCIKVLRENSAVPGACKVVKWMMGCFDALEKGYLHILFIGVHRNAEDPSSIVESYQFKVRYTSDGPQMDIQSSNKLAMRVGLEDTKKASVMLVRKLFLLMQNLDVLPSGVSLTMKLYYYDNVTPPDYQPPGFKEGESDSLWFEGTAVHFKVGDLQTPFHTMKVQVTAEQDAVERMQRQKVVREAVAGPGGAARADQGPGRHE
ncbi:zebrafish testis-expressed 38 [Amia ocellicauda]|uniref:zebrafish testis-expressed 38 n=1 Tax=Amia ocellicauda TaxID=2972642 RepID=UPI0034643E1A